MGLFFSSPKKPIAPVASRAGGSPASHRDQHGSHHGEMNHTEFTHGATHDIHRAFHGTERKVINKMVQMQLDKSSNHRGVMTRAEADEVIKDVHHAFSPDHAEKLRGILEERLQ